jgi:hypothetical protein
VQPKSTLIGVIVDCPGLFHICLKTFCETFVYLSCRGHLGPEKLWKMVNKVVYRKPQLPYLGNGCFLRHILLQTFNDAEHIKVNLQLR